MTFLRYVSVDVLALQLFSNTNRQGMWQFGIIGEIDGGKGRLPEIYKIGFSSFFKIGRFDFINLKTIGRGNGLCRASHDKGLEI